MISSDTLVLEQVDSTFAKDVREGLESSPKRISSKYFYDEKGDALFQQIMQLEEYYPTDCEFEIFEAHKEELKRDVGAERFQLIELGAGDGTKTKILIDHFLRTNTDFSYAPIDISKSVLTHLERDLAQRWPQLSVTTVANEYFGGLERLAANNERKLVLFLGGNIGNMTQEEAQSFLESLGQHLQTGDLILIGFDLQKDPQTIINAYSDSKGITAQFNLNLLNRINNELGGNFQLDCFQHWATYNPVSGATESHLISTCEQEVFIEALDESFHFDAWEAMHTELSLKYNLPQIEALAESCGFAPKQIYTDDRSYFVDVLWEVK